MRDTEKNGKAANGDHELTPSQRAMDAAWQAAKHEPDAARRRRTRTPSPDGLGKTSQRAAAGARVSPRLVELARTVIKHGIWGLPQAVQTGLVTVSDAAKVAKLPRDVQELALNGVKDGRAKTLAAALNLQMRHGFTEERLTQALTELDWFLRQRNRLYLGIDQDYARVHELMTQLRAAVANWRTQASEPRSCSAIKDAQGQWIPHRHIDAFHRGSQLRAMAHTLADFASQLNTLRQWHGGQLIRDEPEVLRGASDALAKASSWIVCPGCQGNWGGCSRCKQRGWLSHPESPRSAR